jgi:hypothetical protein
LIWVNDKYYFIMSHEISFWLKPPICVVVWQG